jgi:hypothetical protein
MVARLGVGSPASSKPVTARGSPSARHLDGCSASAGVRVTMRSKSYRGGGVTGTSDNPYEAGRRWEKMQRWLGSIPG